MNKDNILDTWLWRRTFNTAICNLISVNLFVLVWAGETTPYMRAIFAITADIVAMLWCGVGESKSVRQWIIKNYFFIHISLVLLDISISPILLYSPYIYMLTMMIVLDGIFMLAYTTLQNELREALIIDPSKRISYSQKSMRFHYMGAIVGACATFIIPIADYGIYYMLASTIVVSILCACMTLYAYIKTKKYMDKENIQFTCFINNVQD
ncbi:MAG: hypothetical protein HDQ88_09430 [Clostridia bacterium]|nr:hypothetical protein [Clostridia bacterium]